MAVRKLEKRSRRRLRRLIVLILVLGALAVTALWFHKTYKIDRDRDVTVIIFGESQRYTEQEIKEYVLNGKIYDYSPLIRLRFKYWPIEPLPFLESIAVSVDNGHVVIRAYEKPPIGCLYTEGYYVYFNRDGEVVSSRKTNAENLPVVTGLVYTNLTMYEPFKVQDDRLFSVIMNLVYQMRKNELEVDEIRFAKDKSVSLFADGNEYKLGARDAYDIQISMIAGVEEKLRERNETLGKDVKYVVNMEHIRNSTDKFSASEVKEESETTPDDSETGQKSDDDPDNSDNE